ncbi:MAG: type II secretion system F family protein [Syntrophomonadaceae bacterium]|jgi:tight adherence protein B
MEVIICLAIFGAISCLVRAFFYLFSKEEIYQKRLSVIRDSKKNLDNKIDWRGVLQLYVNKFSGIFAPRSYLEGIQDDLVKAGIPLRGEEYVAACLALIVILPLLAYLISRNIWLAIIMILCGGIIPQLYVRTCRDRRMQALNLQLGDALVIMANALRAGFGFQQAMDAVRKEMPAPISTEFSWTLREMNLGFGTEEALLNMSKRVGNESLDMVITGIIIQRQIGGNLAEILDNISNTIRERARIKKEIRVLTAQGRMSGAVIGLLPVILIGIMLIINPSYFNYMIQDSRGILILAAAGVSEILGIILIKRITQVDL